MKVRLSRTVSYCCSLLNDQALLYSDMPSMDSEDDLSDSEVTESDSDEEDIMN